jgi:hypothetical protein
MTFFLAAPPRMTAARKAIQPDREDGKGKGACGPFPVFS